MPQLPSSQYTAVDDAQEQLDELISIADNQDKLADMALSQGELSLGILKELKLLNARFEEAFRTGINPGDI